MSFQIIVDQREGEPDILTEFEMENMIIKDENARILMEISPPFPWTFETLGATWEAIYPKIKNKIHTADIYLGDQWIGSTEV